MQKRWRAFNGHADRPAPSRVAPLRVLPLMEEVPVDGLTIADIPALKQRVYDLMEEKLLAYNASWIRRKLPSQKQVNS